MTAIEVWLRAAGALAVIVVVLFALKFLLRSLHLGTWRRGRRDLDVLDALTLSGGVAVYIVRIGERRIALAATQSHVCVVCDLPSVAGGQKALPDG